MKKLFFRKKYITLVLILSTVLLTKAQNQIPDFLFGTWKMETKEVYEHWDILDTQMMKGFTFFYEEGVIKVLEYLEIRKERKGIIYIASVIGQNEGKEIPFNLIQSDSIFVFENIEHDFPKIIKYHIINDNKLWVEVLGDNQVGFSYGLIRIDRKSTD